MIEQILRVLAANLTNTYMLRRKIKKLHSDQLIDCLEELLCHVDIHIADCCFKEADLLMHLGKRLAHALKRISPIGNKYDLYAKKFLRRRCKWLEAQGMYLQSADKLKKNCLKLENQIKANSRSTATNDDSVCRADLTSELGALCLDAALAYANAGLHHQALRFTKKARKTFQSQHDQHNIRAAIFNEASLLYDQGHCLDSNRLCFSLLTDFDTISDKEIMAKTLLQLANNSEYLANSRETQELYSKALGAYHSLKDYKKQAEITHRLGWLLKRDEYFEAALRCLKASYLIRVELERRRSLMQQNYLKAKVYLGLGLIKQAGRSFAITLALAEQISENSYLTLARFGFYKTRGRLPINLRSAMTATSVDDNADNRLYGVSGGFRKTGREGYSLCPYTSGRNRELSNKEKRCFSNLINDLVFCAGATDSIESVYFRKQQQAFRN
ncbi:MAG: hypothetical protein ACI376_03330 [Candidatus Bruticola sp.]